MSLELIPSKKHRVWGWPAVVNFILGSTAAGLYLVNLLFETLYGSGFSEHSRAVSELVVPAMIVIGFSMLSVEAGRPMRGLYLLGNLRRSWMSREVLAGLILVSASITDFLYPNFLLKALSVAASAGLLISHGFIMYSAMAVTAWRVVLVPLIFMLSGLMKGYGTWLILAVIGGWSVGFEFLLIGVSLTIVNILIWLIYLHLRRDSSLHKATEPLRKPITLISTVLIGHIIPVVFLVLLMLHLDMTSGTQYFFTFCAGAGIVAGGIAQKAGMLMKTSCFRSVMIGPRAQVADDTCSLAFSSGSR